MNDLFAAYATQAIPLSQQRKQAKQEAAAAKPLSAFDEKMLEKQRLSRAYRIWRRGQTKEILAGEPRLARFLRYLRTVTAETGDELLEAIAVSDWLRSAPESVRVFALRMIDARCNRINRTFGNEALDDPLPPETNIYLRARDILYAGGRA
jgi:hypothetical protein